MRDPLTTIPQLAVRPFLLLTVVALVLARFAPSSTPHRALAPAHHVLINHQPCLSRLAPEEMLWLDGDTGQTTRVPLRGERMLQAASLSPWRDEQGRCQVVGVRCQGINKGGIILERASFPDGTILNAVETDVFPSGSRICWFPGTRARVLFLGADKRLYHFAFEADARAGQRHAAAKPMDRPEPLAWRRPDPRSEGLWFEDLHWPSDPRFAHLLVARWEELDRPGRPGPAGVAWLRLGSGDDFVEEWGRLLDPSSLPPGARVRSPSIGCDEAGGLMLAYFEGRSGDWKLRLTPLTLGPDGRPGKVTELGRVVAERCLGTVPAIFSRNGRSATVVVAGSDGSPLVHRIDLNERPGSTRLR